MGDLTGLMKSAGFVQVEYFGETGISTSQCTIGGLLKALSPSTLKDKERDSE